MTGDFGFLAPVSAKQSPAVLDPNQPILADSDHQRVGGHRVRDRLPLFGVAMIKTTTLPHWLQSADAYGAEQHTAAIASIRAATARN